MKVLIRCDGDSMVGIGHVMRCLALAQALKDNGDEVIFAACSITEGVKNRLLAEGFDFFKIGSKMGTQDDAMKLVYAAIKINPSWIVTDGYMFSESYQRIVKQKGFRLLCIDDLPNINFISDIVLNQNPGFSRDDYSISSDTRLLLGTNYVLLRKEFRRVEAKDHIGEVKNILITMGGSDSSNFTAKILDVLSNLAGVKITVLLGPANLHIDELRKKAEANTEIVANTEDVTYYMLKADLAIHAAGTTSWELAYLGVPSISFVLSDNQEKIAIELGKTGFSYNLGWNDSFSPTALRKKVLALIDDPRILKEMSCAGKRIIDGCGTQRVIEELSI